MVRPEQVVLFILTAVIRMLGGESAVLFRETITVFQEIALEAQCLDDIYAKFAWWRIVASATIDGLLDELSM